MNSPIPWVGGKAKLLWIIDQLAPALWMSSAAAAP